MFENIDASIFNYSFSFYQNEFEEILRGIIVCYKCINSSGLSLKNNENDIRDAMLNNYLKVEHFKREHFNLVNYHFDSETIENTGRADIRILPVNPYINDKAYYIIECKRLNNQNLTGMTGLNAEYVKNGICRFVTGYYSSYFGINGMIGFVVENFEIDKNITHINSFLNKNLTNDRGKNVNAMPIQKIKPIEISEDFKYSYTSTHQTVSQNEITLYHLMFNFSKQIQ
ncbi:MAG: hypothetical protein H0S84_12450 [Bacteroidales bacterium]|nr:hypothetical protein [Bacteroidales bacterium]